VPGLPQITHDALHKQITGNCGQCHTQKKWTPATFEHDKYFVLDRDHNASCVTCHVRNDYSRYTCYGCHEHTPANIRREHVEEGIRDFDNCVECHRSADENQTTLFQPCAAWSMQATHWSRSARPILNGR
jgi:hypothetical protein